MPDNTLIEVTFERDGERWHAEGTRILDENRLTVGEAISPRDAVEMAAAPALRDALQQLVAAVAGDMQQTPASNPTRAAYLNAAAAVAELQEARTKSGWRVFTGRGAAPRGNRS
jgi:hypothetical protein